MRGCFYAAAPTAGAAPTATGWPAMFARTPAIPMRTCSQIVVIFASVPLPAPAAAAVFGTMAMMDPKIVPRSSTTGILCFVVPAKGRRVGPGGDVWPRTPHGGFIEIDLIALSGARGVYVSKPTAQGASRSDSPAASGGRRRGDTEGVWTQAHTARPQIPVDTCRSSGVRPRAR